MTSEPPPSGATPASEPELHKGAALGRYVIIELLGRGAMGVVYRAFDPELDRRIAVKLLRRGPAFTSGARERLLREGKTVARLSHPNVVGLYDVGTYGDRLFIAMELVEGKTLRSWLEPGRPWREVVAMFVQAARGLAAAHAAGIVHRDFKPDNALVGDDGRVRVVDFGLAWTPEVSPAAGADAFYQGPFAGRSGSQGAEGLRGSLVGTPRYAPPEQLEGVVVDASADQFAFCASLWEALFGVPPFEGEDLLVLLGNIREARLGAPTARGVPGWLREVLRRGLSASREARFPTMGALIEALEHDPAVVRRRWLGASALLTVGLAAVVGLRVLPAPRAPVCPSAAPLLVGTWDDPRRAQVAAAFRATSKPFAEDALRGATRALDAYAMQWVAARGEACEASRVRGEQSSELMDLRVECLGQRLGSMRALVDAFATVDAKGVEGALLGVEGLPPLSDCSDLAALRAPQAPPADPAARARIADARAEIARAFALLETARVSEANDVAERAVRAAQEVGYAPLEAEALEAQGRLLDTSQESRRAIDVLQDAALSAVAGRQESVEAMAWIELVHAASTAGSFPIARDAARHAHAALARDPDDGRLGLLLCNEGFAAWREGRLAEARTALEHSLAIREKLLPSDHPDLATTLMFLANVMTDQGQYDDALTAGRRAIAIRERAFGPAHPSVGSPLMTVGGALLFKGDPAEAETVFQRMVDLKMAAFGPDNEGVMDAIEAVGNAQIHEGKLDAALENEQKALALRERYIGAESEDVARSLVNLSDVYLAMKRWGDVLPLAQRAVAILEKSNGPQSWFIAYPLVQLGRARLGLGTPEAGRAALERALSLVSSPDADPHLTSEVRAAMALVLKASHGDASRAQALAAQARETFLKQPAANADQLKELASAFPP